MNILKLQGKNLLPSKENNITCKAAILIQTLANAITKKYKYQKTRQTQTKSLRSDYIQIFKIYKCSKKKNLYIFSEIKSNLMNIKGKVDLEYMSLKKLRTLAKSNNIFNFARKCCIAMNWINIT